jgi:hypothetical protein
MGRERVGLDREAVLPPATRARGSRSRTRLARRWSGPSAATLDQRRFAAGPNEHFELLFLDGTSITLAPAPR